MKNQNTDAIAEPETEQVETVTEVTPNEKVMAEAQKLLAKREKEMADRKKNLSKYPHAIVESLQFGKPGEVNPTKYAVRIKCVVSGDTTRWVYTSDLFQVNMCEAEAKKAKAAKTATKNALIAKATEAIKNGTVGQE